LVQNPLEVLAARALDEGFAHAPAMAGNLRARANRRCYLCNGYGHWLDKCTVKRDLDRFFRGTAMMGSWIALKGTAYPN